MYKLDKNEEIFYKDYQSSTRKFRISEEIDNKQEIEVCKELELSKDIDDIEVCKYSFHFIRNTIATVNYRSKISVPKARVSLRAVCEILYDHKYLLNPPPLVTIPEESETGEP